MIEFKAILAPTDFSAHAAAALRYACALAERFGATLHLLHVLSEVVPVSADPMLAPVLPPDYFRESERVAREALAALPDPAWGRPTGVVRAVRWGAPVEGVIQYATEHEIDLVVIATHGRTGLGHVLLGSVAERIVRESPRPVLTIRDRSDG